MKIAARIDANQPGIVEGLRKAGASVQTLGQVGDGCPDLLVGFRGVNYLMEIKDPDKPPSKRRLNSKQQWWHEAWRGQVEKVETIEQAYAIIGLV